MNSSWLAWIAWYKPGLLTARASSIWSSMAGFSATMFLNALICGEFLSSSNGSAPGAPPPPATIAGKAAAGIGALPPARFIGTGAAPASGARAATSSPPPAGGGTATPCGMPLMRYSTARFGSLKAARKQSSTSERGNPMLHRWVTAAAGGAAAPGAAAAGAATAAGAAGAVAACAGLAAAAGAVACAAGAAGGFTFTANTTRNSPAVIS
mmetsp:Transcript_19082/g.42943  ORF Transcript_19082/g.42943 Transcript_19082/m.42943 type:complete len:210 (-) Transcript_19082:223-852(-)